MRINHNIPAIKTNMILGRTNNALTKNLERLSSGLRINRAADDSAGLAISEKMKNQIDGLYMGSRIASDGISVIQTAEGALSEVEAMLQRMRELCVQAANDTNTGDDRRAIQNEITQLNTEINRITAQTEFNTKTLLDGNIDRKAYSNNSKVKLIMQSDSVPVGVLAINVTQDARQAVLSGLTLPDPDEIVPDGAGGKININGSDIQIFEGQTYRSVFANIRDACDTMNIHVFPTSGMGGDDPALAYYEEDALPGSEIVFITQAYGSSQNIEIHCDNEQLAADFGISLDGAKAKGVDAVIELVDGFTSSATAIADGDVVTVRDRNQYEVKFQLTPGAVETTFADASVDGSEAAEPGGGSEIEVNVTILDAGQMYLQIGANEDQTMEITIPNITDVTLGTFAVNVCTQEGAERGITLADNAINRISAIRAKLGAYQNRLDHSIASLDTTSENITEALSRIADIDMASEMTKFTQNNVLVQAGTAMLAQANQLPQNILSLLQA